MLDRYLQPNTIHFVLTTENAITRGWHFYSKATIRRSFFGFLHTFMAGNSVTNVEHLPAAGVLRAMLLSWVDTYCPKNTHVANNSLDLQDVEVDPPWIPDAHVPDITKFDELYDLICVGNLIELAEVVDTRLYQDRTSLPYLERLQIAEARERYHDFIGYFLTNYEVLDGDTVIDAEEDLFEVCQCVANSVLIHNASHP